MRESALRARVRSWHAMCVRSGMFRNSLLVLALLGLVPAATAQIQIGARIGRHVSVGATVGSHGVGVRVSATPSRGAHRYDSHRHGSHRPAPVHHQRGHFQTVTERVWVPGCSRQVWVPAQYGWIVDSCGHRRWGVICAGHYQTVQEPGYWKTVTRRVWVPAC